MLVSNDPEVHAQLGDILELEGFHIVYAANVDQALRLLKNECFEVVLADIGLSNKNHLSLFQYVKNLSPDTIRIALTEHFSVHNIVETINSGANSCIMKPVDPQELLELIRCKIEGRVYSKNNVYERFGERVFQQTKNGEHSSFRESLRDITSDLVMFGLTANQARVYATLAAVGCVSVSEVAAATGVRREEVYRILPVLEQIGVVTRKIDKPVKFTAIPPEDATLALIKAKLARMTQEIDALDAKRNAIISKLQKISPLPNKVTSVIDSIPTTRNFYTRLTSMVKKAEKNINAVLPCKCVLQMHWAHAHCRHNTGKSDAEATKAPIITQVRIVTEKRVAVAHSSLIGQLKSGKYALSVKYLENVPFSAFIVDDSEALWGRFDLRDDNNHNLWTNDPVQILILKTAFENVWKTAQEPYF